MQQDHRVGEPGVSQLLRGDSWGTVANLTQAKLIRSNSSGNFAAEAARYAQELAAAAEARGEKGAAHPFAGAVHAEVRVTLSGAPSCKGGSSPGGKPAQPVTVTVDAGAHDMFSHRSEANGFDAGAERGFGSGGALGPSYDYDGGGVVSSSGALQGGSDLPALYGSEFSRGGGAFAPSAEFPSTPEGYQPHQPTFPGPFDSLGNEAQLSSEHGDVGGPSTSDWLPMEGLGPRHDFSPSLFGGGPRAQSMPLPHFPPGHLGLLPRHTTHGEAAGAPLPSQLGSRQALEGVSSRSLPRQGNLLGASPARLQGVRKVSSPGQLRSRASMPLGAGAARQASSLLMPGGGSASAPRGSVASCALGASSSLGGAGPAGGPLPRRPPPAVQVDLSGSDSDSSAFTEGGSAGGPRRRKGPRPPASKRAAERNSAKNKGRNVCLNCGTHQTPQWRVGPQGPRSLCNACGVRFKKGLPLLGFSSQGASGSAGPAPPREASGSGSRHHRAAAEGPRGGPRSSPLPAKASSGGGSRVAHPLAAGRSPRPGPAPPHALSAGLPAGEGLPGDKLLQPYHSHAPWLDGPSLHL